MNITPANSEKTILIVDDTPENLHLLSTTLIEQGYKVRGVVNGAMALRVARSAIPDLVLLDILMPDMSGYEVCQALKQDPKTRDIPIIFLTALDEVLDKVKGFTVGGVDYITKPFQAAEVLVRIETHLALQTAKAKIIQLNAELEQRVKDRTEELNCRNAELQESEARFRLIAENMRDLICLHEPDGRYLYLSPSCQPLLGYHPDELIGTDPSELIHPDDRDRIRLENHSLALQNEPASTTYRIRTQSGNYIWLETLTQPILNQSGEVIRWQTASRDVTERVHAEEQLNRDALYDTLTALPNRTLFMERIEIALRQASRLAHYQFAVLFIDLDRFKLVNDSLGHLVGDQLLIAVARLLENCLRTNDTVARFGGDEFTVLLDDIQDFTDATRIAQRIQENLRSPFYLEGYTVFTTASIGVVLNSRDYQRGVEMLRDADIAMYRAKESGRAGYEVFDKAMHTQALERLQLESDLRKALERQEFLIYYQPIFSIALGELAGFEALIRWQHPTRGLVSPDQFISVAEDSGLIIPIGEWVLREACHQLQQWQTEYQGVNSLTISVNLASKQLKEPNFVQQLDAILLETELEGSCLKLEITESMLMEDTEAIKATLFQIKDRSVQLSIDDFGTGYSSLSYLHRFPINTLKIDRSFVQSMSADGGDVGLVQAIVTLAHTLTMDVVAEGVETVQQYNQLRELNCEFAQGFFFAQPLDCNSATLKELFGDRRSLLTKQ